MLKKLAETSRMIKIEHTLFALPFALIGVIFAAEGMPEWKTLGLVVLAMFFARNSAMAFNRWADAKIDRENPRTKDRSIPTGKLSKLFVGVFTLANCLLFFATCYFINMLAFYLSPVALFIILFYSYTKRFTSFAHMVLGLGLAIAPTGGWIAVRNSIELTPLILSLSVMAWVSGFDILYALQDEEFDRQHGLHSIPARLGTTRSLTLSRCLHAVTFVALIVFGIMAHAGILYFAGVMAGGGLLLYEHTLVKADDLSKLDAAFFTVNSYLSVILLVFTILNFIWN